MNSQLLFRPRSFPARVAELGFSAELPADWITHELPADQVDVSNPTTFVALAAVAAPHAAIVFTIGARPAYEDGTLHDWAWYHLNHNQLQPRAVGRDTVAGVPAIIGEAMQSSELGPMIVRFAFLEDGNRLINLTLTAPEIFADSVRDAWFMMLRTFTLETPRGSRFRVKGATPPVAPVSEPHPESNSFEPQEAKPVAVAQNGRPMLPVQETKVPEPIVSGTTQHADQTETRSTAEESSNQTVAVSTNQPRWWHEALALESADQPEAAEKHIHDNCPHIGYAYSTAEMYRLRMLRMKQAGDLTGALVAFKKSSSFIQHYASLATSGGEGAALSGERDEFRARLIADYGTDPEARQ